MDIISKARALAQNLLDIAWPEPELAQQESAWDVRVRELREEAAYYARRREIEAGGDMRGTF